MSMLSTNSKQMNYFSDLLSITDQSDLHSVEFQNLLWHKPSEYNIHSDPVFIVHTNTIPFASSAPIYNRNETVTKQHNCSDLKCSYSKALEQIHEECPCLKFPKAENLCFLEWIKYFEDDLIGIKPTDNKYKEVMFCTDAISLMDKTYPDWLQKRTGVRGYYKDRDPIDWIILIDSTYWGSHYGKASVGRQCFTLLKYGIIHCRDDLNMKNYEINNLICHCLATIDGCIIKMMLAFPKDCPGYQELSELTAILFQNLIGEYLHIEGYTGTFKGLKELSKHIKKTFSAEDYRQAKSW